MTKKLYLPLLMAIVVALFSSCKKMGPLSADYFTVTPQVLEAVGGKVPATINGKFPEKYFKKKAVVEVTPVLKWNDIRISFFILPINYTISVQVFTDHIARR